GARGNSGVILSQIIRGAAEVLGSEAAIDARVVARAFQAARDAAYRAVREPGVVDAGGAGLFEILRGIAATVTGEGLPDAPFEREELNVEAIHQELSKYRY